MSYEEYLEWADDDTHAEWVDGEVIVYMPPKTRHQDLVAFLLALMRVYVQFFRLGQLLPAPFEMRLTPAGPSREPGLLFIKTENLDRLTDERLVGPADLVVEVVSDESVSRDRSDKFYEYQEAGVREYWVLDPRPGKQRADFWVLEEGRYRPVPAGGDDERYHSTVIPGFWLRESWLWSEERPDPQTTFGEIVGFPPEVMDTLCRLAARPPE
jgi:Uma2 family endonuclease